MVFYDIDSAIASPLWSAKTSPMNDIIEKNRNKFYKSIVKWTFCVVLHSTYSDTRHRCGSTCLLCRTACRGIGMQDSLVQSLTPEFYQWDSFRSRLANDRCQHHFSCFNFVFCVRFSDDQLFWRFSKKREK